MSSKGLTDSFQTKLIDVQHRSHKGGTINRSGTEVASKQLKTIHHRITLIRKTEVIVENPATTVQDVTSSVADVQTTELGNQEIMNAMDELRDVYTDDDSLQHRVLGTRVIGKSMPRFQAVVQPFVQVLNVGDHRITATN